MATTQDNQIFIQLESYQTPIVKEHKQSGVVYFGEENRFPDKMIELFNESATHNSIVNGKIGYIVAGGLQYQSRITERNARGKQWLSNPNEFENWDDIIRKVVMDYELHNGFAIEVIRGATGLKYYHTDFSRLRKNTEGGYWYSKNWSKDGRRNYRPEKTFIPEYRQNGDDIRSVIYFAEYRPNMDVYPLPIYMGAIAAIDTDVEIANYWANEIKNGFSGGTMLTFNNGVPQNEEKKKEVERKFKQKFTGSSNAGQLVINFAADKEHAPTLDSLSGNDLPQRYEQLSQAVQQNIFIGHRVTSPMIFGVKTEGQLGGRTEMATAFELFRKTYVSERQQNVLRIVNKLMVQDLQFGGVEFEPNEPIEHKLELSEATIVANLDRNELRELITQQTGIDLKVETAMSFSEEDAEKKMVELFSKSGVPAKDYDVLESFDIVPDEFGKPIEFDFDSLNELDVQILNLIESNPKMSKGEIAKALSVGILEVHQRVGILQKARRITNDGLNWGLLQSGKNLLKILNLPVVKQKTEIKYQYVERDDAPKLKPGGKSRMFCRAMMSIDRLWTREQIDLLRNDMQSSGFAPQVTDVWLSRGGWYRPPGTDISVPFCRHSWKQVIVKKK